MSMTTIEKIKKNSSPFLDFNNIEWGRPIGPGMYGTVSEVVVKQKCALKNIDLKKLCNSDEDKDLERALVEVHEAFIIMNKNLKNVSRTYQYYYDDRKNIYSYTMDIFEKNLFDYIKEKKSLKEAEYLSIFDDIVSGRL